jgi:ribosome assembly protein 4
LDGHAHWVNHLALSTDFVLRTGPYDHTGPSFPTKQHAFDAALLRYSNLVTKLPEMLASASDDFTIIIWSKDSKKPVL